MKKLKLTLMLIIAMPCAIVNAMQNSVPATDSQTRLALAEKLMTDCINDNKRSNDIEEKRTDKRHYDYAKRCRELATTYKILLEIEAMKNKEA